MTMTRWKTVGLVLGAGLLMQGTLAGASPRCERRCAEDKAQMEKVCKETAKNGAPMCIKAAADVKDICVKDCHQDDRKRASGASNEKAQ